MANFNKVILAGNLTRDPELRYTPKGMAVARLGMAINRNWKTETGEQKEEVTFVDIDAFGRQAEVVSQYLRKGRPVLVEGRLRLDQWDDKQTNQKRSKLLVVLESFSFLDSQRTGEAGAGGPPPPPSARSREPEPPPPSAASEPDGPPSASEDDVPF